MAKKTSLYDDPARNLLLLLKISNSYKKQQEIAEVIRALKDFSDLQVNSDCSMDKAIHINCRLLEQIMYPKVVIKDISSQWTQNIIK